MTLVYKIDRAPPALQEVLDNLNWEEFNEKQHDEA